MITHEGAEASLVARDQKNQQAAHQESWLLFGIVLVVWCISFFHCCCNIEDSSALSNSPIPRLEEHDGGRGLIGGAACVKIREPLVLFDCDERPVEHSFWQ